MKTRFLDGEFTFRAAVADDLPLALSVRQAVYIRELGYDSDRVFADPFDERARHFLATTKDGTPIASMRIIHGDARPFELESFIDIKPFVAADSRPGEISRLCVLPKFRSLTRTQFVLAGMWKLAYDDAVVWSLSEFWIWAPPPIARIYEYLGFRQIPGMTFSHPLFGHKVYQVLRIELRNLERDYRERNHGLADLLFGVPPTASGSTCQSSVDQRSRGGR